MSKKIIASGRNPIEDIYTEPYIEELLTVIKGNGNIEEFIVELNKKDRDKFVANVSAKNQDTIIYVNKNIQQSEDKLQKLQEEKRIYNELVQKIQQIKNLYPQDKQSLFEEVLKNSNKEKTLQKNILNLTAPKKGFKGLIEKITQGKRLKQANEQFFELIQYCKDNNVFESSSMLLKSALTGKDSAEELQNIDKKITEEQSLINTYQERLLLLQNNIQKDIDNYDNGIDAQEKRNRINNVIRQFAEKKGPYINNPPTISKEQISTKGLSEEFIEGQIAQSVNAANVRASVRRFYEGLDRPAAPMVAFGYVYNNRIHRMYQYV